MSEAATATPKSEWLPKVTEIVGRYSGDDAEACETICDKIAQWYGDEARVEARELFAVRAAQRQVDAAAEALKKAHDERVAKDAAKLAADAAFKRQQQAKSPDAPPVLSPQSPYDSAGVFIQRECIVDGHCVLWHWQDQFYRWSGTVYEAVPSDVMRGQMYRFLDGSRKRSGDQEVRFQPTPKHVSEVFDALKSRLSLGVECQPPMWISTREPATDWVVFKNKVVNVIADDAGCWETKALTPDLWVHSALGFDWDPDAECPMWMEFLGQVFPGPDMESINLLEEWMGYCMTEETKFQKGLLMIGQKRSGKSTISRVLQQLVGNQNYAGLSFNTWIYSENSKEVLIGKRVGVFADVRFKPGKQYGQNYDAGGITHQSAEFLLNITGADTVTIGRKYKSPWQGQLKLKLMAISNEPPNLNDASGVLPSRFMKLHFAVSFYDREDIELGAKLNRELSGIAVRCVQAYKDLCDRGKFIQPKAAQVLEREILEASDPFTAMVGACFMADLESTATAADLVATAQQYLGLLGRPDEAARIRDNNIINRLRGVTGFEAVSKAPRQHRQTRRYSGVRIRPKSEWKESLE